MALLTGRFGAFVVVQEVADSDVACGVVWERLPIGISLWLVRDQTKDGAPVGVVARG